MQNKNHYVAIMAGGIGSRFWPMSRTTYPKQFLDILNTGRTLIQSTYDRFKKFIPEENIFIVTSEEYVEIVKEQLPELKIANIVAEPSRKNTAPCVAYISYKLRNINPKGALICAPADHLIFDETAFTKVCLEALNFTSQHKALITLGIKPTHPNTGYGYIQYEQHPVSDNVYKVKTFTEKPNAKLAATFLESGDFVWNSGMVVWKVGSLLDAFKKYMPDLTDVFEEGKSQLGTSAESNFIARAYTTLKSISIDYGIMEKSDQVYVVLGDFGWSDIGSWQSLHELRAKDEENNVVEANALLYETKNCFIKTDTDKLVVVQGLDHFLINESENVLLICKLDAENKFRDFVAQAKKKGEDFI